MKLSAQQIIEKLLNDDHILDAEGQITFELANIDIIVRQRDVVGNIMQEWVEGWLKKHNINYALNNNSQMPPDFYLNPDDKTQNLLEIKAFNYKSAPGFDIADFRMYEQELIDKPWMLDVDYLIFGYDMNSEGVVNIKKVWLKKVWEITRSMVSGKGKYKTIWPLNLQIKKGVVHKIRPAKWYTKSKHFTTFQSKEDFLSAVEETVYQNPDTRNDAANWKQQMIASYYNYCQQNLDIPRWNDIKNNYIF